MKALRHFLLGSSLLALLAAAPGCSSQADDGEEDDSALGAADSGKIVPTSQNDVLLFQGYNTLFDQSHGGCVDYPNNLPVSVGNVSFDVKVTWVKSREELAQQLGFDAEAAFKLPQASVDGRAQVMNSFKRNAASTNLLVRVGSSYSVSAGQNYNLTAEARQLLQSDPARFFQRCGDAVVTTLQYRAEVLGLLRFESNDAEKTAKAAASAGVDAPAVASVADAKAKVSGTVDKMKSQSNAKMTLQLFTQGFAPGAAMSAESLQGDAALTRLGELLGNMGQSILNDRKNDVDAVKAGAIPAQIAGAAPGTAQGHLAVDRSARLGALTFHSYAQNDSVPMTAITQLTTDAGRFLRTVGQVQGRLENTYYEEINAFVTAGDQETYNLISSPKGTVQELGPVAQQWASRLRPNDAESITSKLKDVELDCVNNGITGDLGKCKMTEDTQKLVNDGKKALDDYAQSGRVLRMNILYGSTGDVTVDNARAACTRTGGRLPTDQEMQYLRPALQVKGGYAWVSSSTCSKGIGIYSGANGKTNCYNGLSIDWYDSVLDSTGLSKRSAPVFCVANTGPVTVALPPPGQ